ncbi:MAG: PTS sugar transporter subunit IIC [Cetobacterium sp.]|uniref:PTS sugar transporter subunit IIC n=1 Tax=Cetobacterium sp. TaxID=2071632 RepID=UPI003EE5FB65
MFKNLVEKLSELAYRISQQKHLNAIRDGFIVLMPLIIIASFFILLNNVILNENAGLMGLLGIKSIYISKLSEIGVRIYNGTLNIMSILITTTVAYKLSRSYGEDGITCSAFSLASLFIFFPLTLKVNPISSLENVEVAGLISGVHTSSTGLFVGILIALVSTELLIRFTKNEKLKIILPDSVPPSVIKSFNSLIPMTLIMTIFGILAFILNIYFSTGIHEIVNKVIQTPLMGILQGLPGILTILFFQNLLWSFGLHGAFVLAPITETTLLIAIQDNILAMNAGTIPPNIITKPFLDAFGFMGGGGSTIGLIIAILIACKREDYKAVTKLSVIPSLFNINEPLIFGFPIVFNPILSIPLILTPIVNITFAYIVTAAGIISKTTVMVPWTTPPILSAFLATNGDWKAAVVAIICIVISTLIYLPFVLISNKQMRREEN